MLTCKYNIKVQDPCGSVSMLNMAHVICTKNNVKQQSKGQD